MNARLLTSFTILMLISLIGMSQETEDEFFSLLNTVVIDAGHGGHDPGCFGSNSKEKDIALSISLKLGEYLEDRYEDLNVIYTRKNRCFFGAG